MGKKKKNRRVPEVLWKLFRDRARSLANTVAFLYAGNNVSPSSSSLLHWNDPSDYHNLLNQCFIVMNDKAPPLPRLSLCSRWSQHQIVKRTIEMIMAESQEGSNIICTGYDKGNCSSPILELLTDQSWCLFLKRVGDDFMVYLLKHSSIFLPLHHNKHHQVSGPPINDICSMSLKPRAKSQWKSPSLVQFGHQKKRKRVNNFSPVLDRQPTDSFVKVCGNTSSVNCIGCSHISYSRPFNGYPGHDRLSIFSGVASKTSDIVNLKGEEDSDRRFQQSSSQVAEKSRKRLRPFKWQRHRNRRKMNYEEPSDKPANTIICTDECGLPERLQFDCRNKMQEKCSCCLMLRASPLVTKGTHIDRHPIFYSSEYSSTVLPRTHILNSIKPRSADAMSLIGKIFGLSNENVRSQSMPCHHSNGGFCLGSACMFHSLIKLVKVLIRRSQCCQHLRLLDKHCAIPSLDQMGSSSSLFEGNGLKDKVYEKSSWSTKPVEAYDSQFETLKPCLKNQVVSFIWAVCRNVIPSDLLGTPSNWRVLRRNISKFIGLRRFEKFYIKQCMHKLKTTKFPFFNVQMLKVAAGHNVTEEVNDAFLNMKHELLTNWISWFFSSLVVPLVQANFYVTESEHGKQDIYYYRKSVWKMLISKAITRLEDKSYKYLDDAAVRRVLNKRSFGFSKLRLLPKESGVRMLANLKASSRIPAEKPCSEATCSRMRKKARLHQKPVKFYHFKAVNYVLRNTHAVLKGLLLKERDKLGSSVFDYNDVYRKLCPFLIGLRQETRPIPGVFVVVSDVAKAFDSIDQDKLLRVMNDVILDDEYVLEESSQVVRTKKSLWVHDNTTLMDENASTSFTRLTTSLTFPSLHTILVSQGLTRCMTKKNLFFILNEHVKQNVLKLANQFYLQGIGIPQGSVVSALLCSLYYGHMDRNVLYPFIEKGPDPATEDLSGSHNSGQINGDETTFSSRSYMLLRFIDDFLFISTSKRQATNFFIRLRKGFEEYNCYMNEEKYGVNFDIGHNSRLSSNRMIVGEDGITFLPWSGLLINSSTLEVQADYTRCLNNHLSSTLTVCWQGKPLQHLKSKLRGFMRPKCHPILFDSNINSAAIVRLNIYQVFLLCAMKFHCYIYELSYICNPSTMSSLKIIEGSLRYLYVLIRRRMASLSLSTGIQPSLQLEKGEVEWLGLHAYTQVLVRKQSRHRELLALLRSKLLRHRILAIVSSELKYAAERSHSSLIWKIKY